MDIPKMPSVIWSSESENMETRTDRLVPRQHVAFRPTDTGGLLVDLYSGACFSLNRTGAEVWARLTSGATIQETVDAIRLLYGHPAETVEMDVRRHCDELLAAGIVATAHE